ncbi:MAG: exodeoxyribonuclease VII large subunit [Clostridiales Family XIII bacterium]|jgi:exodeoxyribonuclease VII large subunit|nr:exodeoxyribonuclease VII large subunit [Clostridiales Family XIII bacterium]
MKPIRVSQLNAYIRRILTADPILANISIIGEVSNFKRHTSGHVYFSLKDAGAKVNCFLPSGVFASLPRGIGDGVSVTATGYISVYEKGGTYSLNIREIAPEGAGSLAVEFEKLKSRLAEEGLFDASRKKPLPVFPYKVALVTSGTGAAVEDMIKIITRKNDFVDILIYPTLVQGPEAAARISEGLAYINERFPEVDIIITGRGGGSAEELWAFNEERVARAISASEIPVISAVGHETDVTIADFVADVRAETPTAAADMAVPDMADIRRSVDGAFSYLANSLAALTEHMRMRMDACAMPKLGYMLNARVDMSRLKLEGAAATMRSDALSRVERAERRAELAHEKLTASDPGRIMSMGYAALTSGGKHISSASELHTGDEVTARMKDGTAEMRVL